MQAALMIRSKQRIARAKLRRQRLGIKGELPTNVATKDIPPYPRFPPESFDVHDRVGTDYLDSPKVFKCFSLKFILFNFVHCDQLINLTLLHLLIYHENFHFSFPLSPSLSESRFSFFFSSPIVVLRIFKSVSSLEPRRLNCTSYKK